jgi:hypothetical protein
MKRNITLALVIGVVSLSISGCLPQNTEENTSTYNTIYLQGPKYCTYKSDDGITTRTIYTDTKNILTEGKDEIKEYFVLLSGNYSYVWDKGAFSGTKIKYKEDESRYLELYEYIDPLEDETAMLYDCFKWEPDSSKFLIPSDISFLESGDEPITTPEPMLNEENIDYVDEVIEEMPEEITEN